MSETIEVPSLGYESLDRELYVLVEQMAERLEAKAEQVGPGERWLGDDPEFHLRKGRQKAKGAWYDTRPDTRREHVLVDLADAVNHLVMATANLPRDDDD